MKFFPDMFIENLCLNFINFHISYIAEVIENEQKLKKKASCSYISLPYSFHQKLFASAESKLIVHGKLS